VLHRLTELEKEKQGLPKQTAADQHLGTTDTSDPKVLLRRAAELGDRPALERLIESGVDVNQLLNSGAAHPPTGQYVFATALHETVRFSQEAAAQLLLDRGADPNIASSIWFTPLTTAAAQGSGETPARACRRCFSLGCVCSHLALSQCR